MRFEGRDLKEGRVKYCGDLCYNICEAINLNTPKYPHQTYNKYFQVLEGLEFYVQLKLSASPLASSEFPNTCWRAK